MAKQLKKYINLLIEDYKEIPLSTHIVRALHEYSNIEYVPNNVLEESLINYVQQLEFDESIRGSQTEYYEDEDSEY